MRGAPEKSAAGRARGPLGCCRLSPETNSSFFSSISRNIDLITGSLQGLREAISAPPTRQTRAAGDQQHWPRKLREIEEMNSSPAVANLETALIELEYAVADFGDTKASVINPLEFRDLGALVSNLVEANRAVQIAIWARQMRCTEEI
jgi:hypothetical protein